MHGAYSQEECAKSPRKTGPRVRCCSHCYGTTQLLLQPRDFTAIALTPEKVPRVPACGSPSSSFQVLNVSEPGSHATTCAVGSGERHAQTWPPTMTLPAGKPQTQEEDTGPGH